MNKILVTGATGGLGGAVVRQLLARTDKQIFALVRNTDTAAAQALADLGVVLREGDYNDRTALVAAFEGIDILYFVSGNDIETRLSQHENVIRASVSAEIKHIVYTSAGRKDESADAPLAGVMKTHIATENWIKSSGIRYTILRHNLYAEVVPMFLGDRTQLLATKTVYLPTGTGKTAFVSRAELAEAGAIVVSNTAKHAGRIYALNGSRSVTFEEIATALSTILGTGIGYVSPDTNAFQSTMKAAGLPDAIIGMMLGFSLGIATGEFDDETADLEHILGRTTQPIADFLTAVYSG